VSALLTDGNLIGLTGVTTANLPAVLAAGGQEVRGEDQDDEPEPEGGSVAVDDPVDQRLPGGEEA
jgi:hypothetical protein